MNDKINSNPGRKNSYNCKKKNTWTRMFPRCEPAQRLGCSLLSGPLPPADLPMQVPHSRPPGLGSTWSMNWVEAERSSATPAPPCFPIPGCLHKEWRPCSWLIPLNSYLQFLSSSSFWSYPCRGLGKGVGVERVPLPAVRAESADLLSLRWSRENGVTGDTVAWWKEVIWQ